MEKDNVLKVGKEETVKKFDTEWVEGELNKLDIVDTPTVLNTEEQDVKVTVKESESKTEEEKSETEPFTFDSNSDELIKISVRESDDDQIKITVKDEDDGEKSDDAREMQNDVNSSSHKYKMPTF